jgi:uncharacterized membrane protein
MKIKMTSYTITENALIAVACTTFGLMTGFFWTYSFNVNLALLQVDGPTYAVVQSLLNRNVRHIAFFVLFFGAGIAPLVAALVNYKHRKSLAFWLVVASGVAYLLGVIFFTREVNLPLNAYTESWAPLSLPADWATTRAKWNEANAVRVWVSLFSFLLCLLALVLRGSHKGA